MTIKNYLESIQKLDERIDVKMEQIERLRTRSERMCSLYMPIESQHQSSHRSVMECIDALIDMERETNQLTAELMARKQEAIDLFARVSIPTAGLILEMKYLNGQTWEDISKATNYSIRQAQRIHNAALPRLESMLNSVHDVALCRIRT